ncbi:hypothetical protein [Kribbella sp. NPDC051770]|uniref:hypothetical protein n=1 Tax=Kribbella sp. NPDC051770 TaxID=3155413 RepID=UPI003418A2AA
MQPIPTEAIHRITTRTLTTGGATFDLTTLSFVPPADYWYFPRHPSRTAIVDQHHLAAELATFIDHNRAVCETAGTWLGTWLNPSSGQCYLDVTTRLADRDAALREARRVSDLEGRRVVSIYNPGRDRTAYVRF